MRPVERERERGGERISLLLYEQFISDDLLKDLGYYYYYYCY